MTTFSKLQHAIIQQLFSVHRTTATAWFSILHHHGRANLSCLTCYSAPSQLLCTIFFTNAISRFGNEQHWVLYAMNCLLHGQIISFCGCRACFARGRNAATERCAVNTLRLLCSLLSRPAMRGSATAFRTFLPPLLRPLLDLLRPPG